MSKKTVIIGGVAGGATTAARLRRKDETMEIILFERGEYISYANCGLPYYIGDVIKSRDALLLQTPEAMRKKFQIDVRISSEVTAIHPERKTVSVKNKATGEEYEESYDNLVIATGSSPLKPAIPGIDGKNIETLWTVPDTDKIKKILEEKNPKSVAIIGGGFIGLEMAENLHQAGLNVTVIEMQNQVMAPLDSEMANLVHEELRRNQIQLLLGDGVKEFNSKENCVHLTLSSGKQLTVDFVLLSIGVKPNSEIAKAAGIQVNPRGGSVVDETLQTSEKEIYALGDVIEVNQLVTGDKTMIPLAGPANKQGRILADILTGEKKTYQGSLGTAVVKVLNYDIATVGLNEKQLKAAGKRKRIDYDTVLINQKSHAGYYPDATMLTLKLIFGMEGNIYGAQIIGQEGVDKRIDSIAITMRLHGTIYDLEELELAYAPPFSSAKDPVNMLGFVAENILKGLAEFIEWDEVDAMMKDQERGSEVTILDVTEDIERMVYSIPNSYHIPLGQLRDRLEELDKDKTIIPYCAVGIRSYNAARILMQHGFEHVKILSGGTSFYRLMHEEEVNEETLHDSFQEYPQEIGETKNDYNREELELSEEMEEMPELTVADLSMKIVDCTGLQCPGPIMKVNQVMADLNEGQVLQVMASDLGFAADISAWCNKTGNTLVKTERIGKDNIVYLKKGSNQIKDTEKEMIAPIPQGKTLIVFSGDLDKVLASFIIANGAAAMGRPVTIFFTFWGLNVLRKSDVKVKHKPLLDKMFGWMMPKGIKKLKLSKMNMAGMGTAMMKKVMKDKNVDSLEDLMKAAMANGVRLIACTMSMDVMGIRKEELIDGVEFAGVATYLSAAEDSNVNLFV